jgi:hypothetical protein
MGDTKSLSQLIYAKVGKAELEIQIRLTNR